MVNRKGVVVIAVLALGACERSAVVAPEPEPELNALTAEQLVEIATASETAALLAISEGFLRRVEAALAAGMTVAELREMRAQSDDGGLGLVLFGSAEAADHFRQGLAIATNRVAERFPVLRDPNLVLDACQPLDIGPVSLEGVGQVSGDTLCGSYWQQVKLAACAVGAQVACGPGYFFCAWGCWCMLCNENSAVADVMC